MRHRSVSAALGICLALTTAARAQEVKPPAPPPEFDPATEPAVVAVAKVLPAVVNIATERTIRQKVQDPFEDFYEQFFNAPSNRRPREYKQTVQSLGSGFLIDAEGNIVTNEHVVERAADLKIQVTFSDGASLPARYVSGDAQADLALIKVDRGEHYSGKPFPFINLNNPSPNLLGETVLVLGNPLGYNSSVARGILSANDREITVEETNYKHLLQTDAAINPGNSGGPLIDLAGRLVGISSVKLAFTPQGTPTQGLGFAIPARTVAAKIAEFRDAAAHPPTAKRSAPANASPNARRLFGLQLQTLTPDLARAFGLRAGGGRGHQRRGNGQPGGARRTEVGDGRLQDRHVHRRQCGAGGNSPERRGRRHVGGFCDLHDECRWTRHRTARAGRHGDARGAGGELTSP